MEAKTCIDHCRSCEQICLETVTLCLEQGGRHADAKLINALIDCVLICGSSAELMTRRSPLQSEHCRLCAEACRLCAEACEAIGGEHMESCAAACRACEKCCAAMCAHC